MSLAKNVGTSKHCVEETALQGKRLPSNSQFAGLQEFHRNSDSFRKSWQDPHSFGRRLYIKSVQTLLVYFHWGGTLPPLTLLECILFLLLGFIRTSKSYKVSSDERRERGWEEGFSSQNAAIWNVTWRVGAVLQESSGLDHTACCNTKVCAPGVLRLWNKG